MNPSAADKELSWCVGQKHTRALSQTAFGRVAGGSEAESSGPKVEGGWEGHGFNNRSVVPSTCAVSLFQMQCDARAKADEFWRRDAM
jgi:hypothetical protein